MQGNSQDEHDGDDDGDDVEGDHGDGAPVPAVKHGGVTQLDQEDVDHAHGAQQQGLDGDWKTQKNRDGQVTIQDDKVTLCDSCMQIRFGTHGGGDVYTLYILYISVITSAYKISEYNEEEGTTGGRDDSEF